jgi:hypothetical protein
VTLPATVYVPSARVRPGDDEVQLVLRRLADGSVVLPAYSSLDELVRCCGEDQPWVALPAGVVEVVPEQVGARAVVLDARFQDPTDADDPAAGDRA